MANFIIKSEIRKTVNGKGMQFSAGFLDELDKLVGLIVETCMTNVGLEGRKRLSEQDIKEFNDWVKTKKEVKEPKNQTKAEEVKETIALVNETNKDIQV